MNSYSITIQPDTKPADNLPIRKAATERQFPTATEGGPMNRRRFVAAAGLVLAAPGLLAAQDTSGRGQNSKLIIEVRANEWTKRRSNPHIPYTDQEIIADAQECARAGAAIYHFHCRTDDGEPNLTYPPYKNILAGIRAHSAILIHPTLG